MKKLVVLLIAVLMATGLSAQNLVTNGNFSVKASGTLCPNSTGFDHGRPDGWYDEATKPQGFLPYAETPDYFHPCAPNGTFNPGSNTDGCADPKTGTAYTGLLAWTRNNPDRSAEYMYQELASPLIKNQTYYIEFWVSAADGPQFNYFVASLGMYLTNNANDFNAGQGPGYHNLASSVQIPQTFPAGNYYTTTNGWQKISGTYTPAVDGVKHILIGNFDPGIAAYDPVTNPNSPNIQHRSGASTGPGQTSYYFIDAVYIAPASQGTPNYNPVVSGSSVLCTSNSTYTLSNYNSLASITWQASPSSLFAISSGFGPTATLQAKNTSVNGLGTLTFTIQGVCDSQIKQKAIWVGNPGPLGSISGPNSVSQGQWVYYSVSSSIPNNGTYDWMLPYSSQPCLPPSTDCWYFLYGGDGSPFAQVSVGPSSGLVQVKRVNACGSGPTTAKYVDVSGGGGGGGCCITPAIVSPNPATHEISIMYMNETANLVVDETDFDQMVEYTLTDFMGNIVFSKSSKKTKLKLNISRVREDGIYVLSIKHGNQGSEQHRVVIDR